MHAPGCGAQSTTVHDTIDPTPHDGTQVKLVSPQSGHADVSGARRIVHASQRRIINAPSIGGRGSSNIGRTSL
ncbi:hypothetical protein GCM10023094_04380 [Rhodococcus olei]|uniref:Uncharacterized protein n=1 Tax=Rhodococcus olei TaxID=2161675 RepID=A0ABP8NUQ0_9NOCA